jgi:hypothetical protein
MLKDKPSSGVSKEMELLYADVAETVAAAIRMTTQWMRNRREKSALFAKNGNHYLHFTSTRFAATVWNRCASSANSSGAKSATPNTLNESGIWI